MPTNYEDRGVLADCIGEWARTASLDEFKHMLALTLQGIAGASEARLMSARTLQAMCATAHKQMQELDAVAKVVAAINKVGVVGSLASLRWRDVECRPHGSSLCSSQSASLPGGCFCAGGWE